MIDRCNLFGRSQDCPTVNDAACRSVMHKIPGLSEHFVAMDDDFLLLRPLKPSDFFASERRNVGKPLVLAEGALKGVPMYHHKPPGPDMPPNSVPTRMSQFHHTPTPNLVSFARQLENTYPDWFAFVRSHRTRFVCCNATTRGNGLDEEFQRVYPHMLLKLKVGIRQPVNYRTACRGLRDGGPYFIRCMTHKLKKASLKFMTLQNIYHVDTWRVMQRALEEHIRDMATSQFVVQPLGLDRFSEPRLHPGFFGKYFHS